jgi:hypothetical protein
MISFAARRWYNAALLTVCCATGLLLYAVCVLSLRHTSFSLFSGWALFFLLLALALYTVRKKLPFLPLLSSAQWLQFHIYAGLLSGVLFLLHIDFRIPDGALEQALAALYVAVFGSGVAGLGLSRAIPRRLTTRGEEVLFERIPVLMRQVRERAEQTVARAAEEENSVILADFYASRLVAFFAGPRHLRGHLIESSRPRYRLLNELDALNRYLNDPERAVVEELDDLIRRKDDLDYHYAHQAVLKYWLFVHIPLTYSLLMAGAVHGLLVHAFGGGTG